MKNNMERLIDILKDKGYDMGYLHSLLGKNGHMGIYVHNPLNPGFSQVMAKRNEQATLWALVEAQFLPPFSDNAKPVELKIRRSPCY